MISENDPTKYSRGDSFVVPAFVPPLGLYIPLGVCCRKAVGEVRLVVADFVDQQAAEDAAQDAPLLLTVYRAYKLPTPDLVYIGRLPLKPDHHSAVFRQHVIDLHGLTSSAFRVPVVQLFIVYYVYSAVSNYYSNNYYTIKCYTIY